jgi:hypothetical protein
MTSGSMLSFFVRLGQFHHVMEDPVEKLHKEEKLLDRACCHFRSCERERKQRQFVWRWRTSHLSEPESTGVKEGKKRRFSVPSTKNEV